jgi:hypothetical protein
MKEKKYPTGYSVTVGFDIFYKDLNIGFGNTLPQVDSIIKNHIELMKVGVMPEKTDPVFSIIPVETTGYDVFCNDLYIGHRTNIQDIEELAVTYSKSIGFELKGIEIPMIIDPVQDEVFEKIQRFATLLDIKFGPEEITYELLGKYVYDLFDEEGYFDDWKEELKQANESSPHNSYATEDLLEVDFLNERKANQH